jgi:hypothetical protein
MKHIIRKEVIALSVEKGIDVFSLQQQLSRVNEDSILPILEKVFDELSEEDELFSLEKLEIDLGNIRRDAFDHNGLENEIINKIREQVREQLKEIQYSTGMMKEPLVSSRARIWMQFLITGRLGWNITVMDTVFRRQVLESLAGNYSMVRQLREIIYSSPDVVKRVVYQHDEEFVIRLMGILTAEKQDDFKKLSGELIRLFRWMNRQGHRWADSIDDPGDPEIYIFIGALRIAAKGESGSDPEAIAARVLQPELLRFIKQKEIPGSILVDFPLLKPLIKNIIKGAAPAEPEEIKEKEMALRKEEAIEDEGIFVELAGLVLLHPFLQQLFKRQGLVNEEGFVSDKARLKALYLLYFLGTGEKDPPEEKLVVAKLLCDYPTGIPVKRKFSLTKKEVDECTGLLYAVIGQWSILGNTSVEGLRESFLRRNGKIFHRNDNIYIQVEPRAFDVLLDRLPWNLGIIKLPWKKELIRVEWR